MSVEAADEASAAQAIDGEVVAMSARAIDVGPSERTAPPASKASLLTRFINPLRRKRSRERAARASKGSAAPRRRSAVAAAGVVAGGRGAGHHRRSDGQPGRRRVTMHGPTRLTCEEVFSRLDDFLDRELSADEIRLVEEHLATCAACAGEHRFEARVLENVRSKLRRIAVPADLKASILRRLSDETRPTS